MLFGACGNDADESGGAATVREQTSTTRPVTTPTPTAPIATSGPPRISVEPSTTAARPETPRELDPEHAVEQLIGTTFVHDSTIEPTHLGDLLLPTGSMFLLGSLVSDTGAAVVAYTFRPGHVVRLLTVPATPVGDHPAATVHDAIDVAIAPHEQVDPECSIDGARSQDVVGVIDLDAELSQGPNALRARVAWRFDPDAGTISEIDPAGVTCEFVVPH